MATFKNSASQACAEDRMTALVCDQYGPPDVLKFARLARPLPKKDEVLVRVEASTITAADRRVRSLDMPKGLRTLARLALGWNGPRNTVLGAVFAGMVCAVGSDAKDFAVGDAVFGISGFRMNGHAEYLCIPATGAIAHKPDQLSFEEAAALPFGATTALSFLRRARLLPGETVLVNGASGAVGTATVQLAQIMGGIVTGVCSAAQADQVCSLGVVRVINYQQEDFTALGQRYDVVFDVACNQSIERCLSVLHPGGRLIRITSSLTEMVGAMLRPRRAGRQIIVGTADEKAADLNHVVDLVRQGRYRPVIARVFRFDEAIKAHKYADRPSHGASVVIKMTGDAKNGV
jgi:NADPH:quinone reductase-like Zn-dependent oxidoreductase